MSRKGTHRKHQKATGGFSLIGGAERGQTGGMGTTKATLPPMLMDVELEISLPFRPVDTKSFLFGLFDTSI